jgi:hypothetical protein
VETRGLNPPPAAVQTFTVRVSSAARRALSRAKAAQLTLEVTVNGTGTAARSATRRVTLG